MPPKLLKRISKLLVHTRRRSEPHGSPKKLGNDYSRGRKDITKGTLWDSKYTWNVADDEEIAGTVRIVLKACDPQRSKHQVVFSVLDRCFVPVDPDQGVIELFNQDSSSVLIHGVGSRSSPINQDELIGDQSIDKLARDVEQIDIAATPIDGEPGDVDSVVDDYTDSSKRKTFRAVNQFSCCDRATQTTVPPTRVSAIQTEAPSRVSFATTANAWIIHDAYTKDQQQKTAAAAAASTEAPVLLLQPATGDGSLGCDAAIRLEETARVVERMINQNIYDEIAQDFKYWEDAADEYRELEGTLMPLWRFIPPAILLRKFEENGSICNHVPSYVTAVCWNPHHQDLFAMALGSRDNMSVEAGLVCVFSLKSPSQPERSSRLQAGVASLDFHRQFWQLLAVGLHDGHVAVIDLTQRRDPLDDHQVTKMRVYRSSALRGKRILPVTQVKWSGDVTDGNLKMFSISVDGCLCLWLFVQGDLYPTELITIPFQGDINRQLESNKSFLLSLSESFSCMALHPNQSMILIGTDQGQLWPISTEGEILNWGPISGHQGPIYTVEWNPFHPNVFLTCGTDWKVRIWDHREKDPLVVLDLCSEAEDAIWSPYSSTALACISAQGKVFIYDLAIRLHKPLCCQRIAPQRRAQPTKLTFGHQQPVLLVGDDKGHATCLKLSPNLHKITKVPESGRAVDIEVEKLERIITLMKKSNAPL